MAKGKGSKAKGSKKQSFSQQTPMTVNVKDDREASNSGKVTSLKNLNEGLVTTITSDRKGLQDEQNATRVLSLNLEKECIQLRQEKVKLEEEFRELNNRNEELHAKMIENGGLWDTCKAKLESIIIDMQRKLNETKILAHNNQVSCNEMSREKRELENKLNQSINEARQLEEKIAEERHLWDIGKREFEVALAKLQNELNEVRMSSQKHEDLCCQSEQDKNELECNLKSSIDEARQFKEKIAEERHLWDTYKGELEVTIAKLQNKLNQERMLTQKNEDLWSYSEEEKNELKKILLMVEKELDETKILRRKDQELCNVLREGKKELEKTLLMLQNELGETKILRGKDQELCNVLREEKNELEKSFVVLQTELGETKILREKDHELCNVLREEKNELEKSLVVLQTELDETKILRGKDQELCNVLREVKNELENTLPMLQNELAETKILRGKDQELCNVLREGKNELEKSFVVLQTKLGETKILREKDHKQCNVLREEKNELEKSLVVLQTELDETKILRGKDQELCYVLREGKKELEKTLLMLQNELCETKILRGKDQELCNVLREEKNELEKSLVVLQTELGETKILREKDHELCNLLREENNRLETRLKQCNDMNGELNTKIKEDELLWVSNKEDLVVDLQYEKEIMIEEYKALCTHLTEEKDDLEDKLRECNKKNKELHAQMREDCLLWEACRAKFEDSIAGLQNKLDSMTNEGRILRQEYVQLYIECEFFKAQLGDYNGTLSSMEDETWSLSSLSESNAKTVEALQTQVQSITNDQTHLSKKYEELTTENESLKLKLENYGHSFDLVENERNSLMSTLASRENALIQENGSLRQEVHELQNKLGMFSNDYKRVSINDMLDSATGETQLLTSLSETSDKVMEDLVTENRTAKQEALQIDKENQALVQENYSLKQQVYELQNKLGMRANDYKSISSDDMPHSATGERQILTSLSDTSNKVMEDLLMENRIVKQEAIKLDQENQLLQKDIFAKKSLLHTQDRKITEMNAKMIELKNLIDVFEEIGRKNTKLQKESGDLVREEQMKRRESEEKRKEGSWRVSNQNQRAFIGNLTSCILPDINKTTVSKYLSTGAKFVVLPSEALLCGCPYGCFGGIV